MIVTITDRQDFMAFFRDDEKLNLLTADDRVEIFLQILLGQSDITKELLDELLGDYGVGNLIIIDVDQIQKMNKQMKELKTLKELFSSI